MEEKKEKIIRCIDGEIMRDIINKSRELNIKKEDIVQIVVLKNRIYLIYYM